MAKKFCIFAVFYVQKDRIIFLVAILLFSMYIINIEEEK